MHIIGVITIVVLVVLGNYHFFRLAAFGSAQLSSTTKKGEAEEYRSVAIGHGVWTVACELTAVVIATSISAGWMVFVVGEFIIPFLVTHYLYVRGAAAHNRALFRARELTNNAWVPETLRQSM